MNKKQYLLVCVMLLMSWATFAQDTTSGLPGSFTPVAFQVLIKDMLPRPFFFRYGTDEYYLRVLRDSVFVYMPYYGDSSTPAFEYNGLSFETEYEHMQAGRTEKGDASAVTFRVQQGSTELRFYVAAYPDHNADITVTPSNAQACSYTGEWSTIDVRQLSYIALVLDEASSNVLKAFAKHSMPWDDATSYCHHMTIAHHTNVTPKLMKWAQKHEGETFTLRATDYGYSDKAYAMKVNAGKVPSVNRLTHVTMATNNATQGKAVDSNNISTWTKLTTPITLTGTVQFIYK